MESFPFLVVAFLALCMMPQAFSLQCYECTDNPGVEGSRCSNVGIITCSGLMFDSCMTLTYKLANKTFVQRNCSSSIACNPQYEYYPCKLVENITQSCKLDCCQGDLCNDLGQASTVTSSVTSSVTSTVASNATTPPGPTSSVPGLAVSFGAIIAALLLTIFAGFN